MSKFSRAIRHYILGLRDGELEQSQVPKALSRITHERDGLAMARSLLSCLRRAVSLLSMLLRIMAYEPRVMILRIIVQCSFAVVMVRHQEG